MKRLKALDEGVLLARVRKNTRTSLNLLKSDVGVVGKPEISAFITCFITVFLAQQVQVKQDHSLVSNSCLISSSAIRDALQRGTLCICSAGNDGGPINYPAAYPECAAVSAIGLIGWAPVGTFSANNRPHDAHRMGQNNLFLASFSSFGPALACAAPGVGIVSTVPDRKNYKKAYMEMDGTSMASPAVCAALAVVLAKDAACAGLPRDLSRSKRATLL